MLLGLQWILGQCSGTSTWTWRTLCVYNFFFHLVFTHLIQSEISRGKTREGENEMRNNIRVDNSVQVELLNFGRMRYFWIESRFLYGGNERRELRWWICFRDMNIWRKIEKIFFPSDSAPDKWKISVEDVFHLFSLFTCLFPFLANYGSVW